MKRYNRQMPLSLGSCGCNCACDRARCGEGAANCCESAAEPDVDVVSVKARMGHDQTRRFSLQSSQRDVTSLFSFLRKIFGVTGRILVTYQNSDGGIVPLSSDADLCNAVSCAQKAATPILYLFVTPKNDGIRPKTADMIYTGENLRAVTLPMGGIGTGSVSICGDGGFRQWEIVNEVYHTAQVPHSFFAAKIGTNGVVLQSSQNYDQSDFTPAPLVSDHVVPDSSKTLLSTLPSIPSLSLTAKYPIAELSYDTSALGTALQFSSRIYTPFCPLNIQYSSLPVVICQFNVSNTTTSPVSASLMMTQQNFVGWDGKSQITDVSNSGYGNNINSATTQINGTKWVSMYQTGTQDSAPYVGHVGLCVLSPDASDTVQLIEQWTDLNTIWAEFMGTTTTTTTTTTKTKTSSPQPGQTDPSPSGTTWNAAAIVSFTVAAQSTHTVNFALVWHFPNHWVNYSQPYNIADSKSKLWLGNQYTTFWPSIVEVVNYITTNFSTLDAITQAFVDSFYSSTLNWQILESAGGRISVLRSPTCFITDSGRLHAFEGCCGCSAGGCDSTGGCCPMDCTHVWNYEMTLSRLFPTLEQGMRETELFDKISPYGVIPERTVLPSTEMKQEWQLWSSFQGGVVAMDGELGTILKTYRELLQGGSSSWFLQKWPQLCLLMSHIMTDYDVQGDGVIRGEQFNTYDCSIYGANTFIGSLYLCALRAMEEMALLVEDTSRAAKYRDRYLLGTVNYDKLCWNDAGWFVNVGYDANNCAIGNGCFIDQLLGQWWAFILDLGYILPEAHVKAATQSIFDQNRQVGFDPASQTPRVFMDSRDNGLWIGTYSLGAPPVPILYSYECWSGVEYPVAALAFYQGLSDTGNTICDDIRARQDGSRRSPWNEVECGDHYARPQSSWSLIDALTGFQYSSPAQTLKFLPRVSSPSFQCFFCCGSGSSSSSSTGDGGGWGNFLVKGTTAGTAQVILKYGSIPLKSIGLGNCSATQVTAKLAGSLVATTFSVTNGYLMITFTSAITVTVSSSLFITFSS